MTAAHPPAAPPGRTLGLAVTTAAITGGLAVLGSAALGIPLKDPDGFLGPSWMRLPLIVGICLVLDVVPRALWRARGLQGLPRTMWQVLLEHWPLRRLGLVLLAVTCFYVTYVGYRNLKNYLPFVYEHSYDIALIAIDRTFALGHDPAEVLHALLGTGAAAHVLSWIYIVYLFFVPISLAVSLVWSKHLSYGVWYATALCLNWALGTLSYYLIPASGPFWASPFLFVDLAYTDTTALQDSLVRNRDLVLSEPATSAKVSGIAAFASLHTSVVFTAALMLELVRAQRWLRHVMWWYFALVVVATIYFGWHYIVDDIAGVAIGGIAVWLGAWATGNLHVVRRAPLVPVRERERESALVG